MNKFKYIETTFCSKHTNSFYQLQTNKNEISIKIIDFHEN